jgi:CBS domain-containing protein
MDHLGGPADETPASHAGAENGSNADRFLVAFARVEDALKRLLGSTSRDSFRWVVRQAAKRHALVASVEEDLVEYSDLRNAIVHERGGGYVIAEPHLATVERLERIVDLIMDPPRVAQTMSRPVAVCGPDDPIREAARRMVRGQFSRMPVCEEGGVVGLLTANAVARWISARLDGPPDGALEALREEPVRNVMAYGEASSRYGLVGRDLLVAEAIGLFRAATEQGRRIEAVLVTRTGSAAELPEGIITVQDLPRLYDLVAP